jgi:glycosyltransferase involved in cell wall biosynthesis
VVKGTIKPARQRPRILLSINTAWNVYNFRANLVRALIKQRYEVVAAAPPDAYSARLGELGCRYVPLPIDSKGASPLQDMQLMGRYWRLLRGERPDVFLGYTIKPNVYGSLIAHILGIPVVNNIAGLGTAFIKDTWLTRLAKALYRTALRRSHTVFFQNDDDRQFFISEKIVRRRQTRLVPGSGIDLSRFSLNENARRIEGEPFRFLLVARLLWDKGVGEYVEAARIVRRHAPKARFQLLGFLDVENRTAVPRSTVNRWSTEGIVEYLGVTDDVRPVLAAADCIVLPSYREGTPRSLLEAAASGRPVIATDVPGCRQVVEDAVNGYLCNPRDSKDLAEKMLKMICLSNEERRAMGRAGRLKMEQEFDERIVITRYLEVIEQLLAK